MSSDTPQPHDGKIRSDDPAVCWEARCWCWRERGKLRDARVAREEASRVRMEGVREWGEGYVVSLVTAEANESVPSCGPLPDQSPRLCIEALNEGGYNATRVDLLDLLRWVQMHRPDLLSFDPVGSE